MSAQPRMEDASSRRVITWTDATRLRTMMSTRAVRNAPLVTALDWTIASALIVPALAVPPDVITMNSQVVCESSHGDVEATLVFPWDEGQALGKVSVLSELGLALLGSRIGARIRARTWLGNTVQWGVSRLLYQPEEAGDLHL